MKSSPFLFPLGFAVLFRIVGYRNKGVVWVGATVCVSGAGEVTLWEGLRRRDEVVVERLWLNEWVGGSLSLYINNPSQPHMMLS